MDLGLTSFRAVVSASDDVIEIWAEQIADRIVAVLTKKGICKRVQTLNIFERLYPKV